MIDFSSGLVTSTSVNERQRNPYVLFVLQYWTRSFSLSWLTVHFSLPSRWTETPQISSSVILNCEKNRDLPSASIKRGTPRCFSAMRKAFSNRSRTSMRSTRRRSTRSGRREWIRALNARPSRQLEVKSRTSNPLICLHEREEKTKVELVLRYISIGVFSTKAKKKKERRMRLISLPKKFRRGTTSKCRCASRHEFNEDVERVRRKCPEERDSLANNVPWCLLAYPFQQSFFRFATIIFRVFIEHTGVFDLQMKERDSERVYPIRSTPYLIAEDQCPDQAENNRRFAIDNIRWTNVDEFDLQSGSIWFSPRLVNLHAYLSVLQVFQGITDVADEMCFLVSSFRGLEE